MNAVELHFLQPNSASPMERWKNNHIGRFITQVVMGIRSAAKREHLVWSKYARTWVQYVKFDILRMLNALTHILNALSLHPFQTVTSMDECD